MTPRLPDPATPRLPDPTDEERAPTEGERNSATCLALVALLSVGGALLGVVAMVLPGLLWILLVAFGSGLILTLQYLIWGRYLTRVLGHETPTEED